MRGTAFEGAGEGPGWIPTGRRPPMSPLAGSGGMSLGGSRRIDNAFFANRLELGLLMGESELAMLRNAFPERLVSGSRQLEHCAVA
jgi:hypothetical protein